MIFTSYTYLAFLALTFLVHWSIPVTWRKPLLIAASYAFYCSWRWEFGFLLLGVSLFNWWYARAIVHKYQTLPALLGGVAGNLVPLIYFKYTGFLVENASAIANLAGANWHPAPWEILLPIGVSFFTFQGIAYQVDVATGDEPAANLADFLLFKAFWPQLIAGPIIRLHEIRDQLESPRALDYEDVAAGCQRILSGFFKKVVLADNIAPIVDLVFLNRGTPNAIDCAVGILGFGLQIYFDFSAYSDIAIGSARLFGYKFPENFNWPYVSASPAEFWNRWHMTLSRWIRDYTFTPLTFMTRDRPALGHLWLLLAMAICGLWHGARWTFVVWGLWHGLLLVANRTVLKDLFPRPGVDGEPTFRWKHLPAIALTFALINLGWLFFRAQSLEQCAAMIESLITLRGGLRPSVIRENSILLVAAVLAGMVLAQIGRDQWVRFAERSLWGIQPWSIARPVVYALAILLVIVCDRESQTFVYFQF
ncbi:MAG: MBOAT family protein [Planctomycetaceae bacterium]|nr:MAG: MBOAT family protein [Planctomycetaceae bacterium]